MQRYRLEGFENHGLGDESLGTTTVEASDRYQAVLLGIAYWTGNPVGACLRRRLWVKVDELWGGVVIDPIEYSILKVLSQTPQSLDTIDAATRRLPPHVRRALMTLELKGLVRQLPGHQFIRLTEETP